MAYYSWYCNADHTTVIISPLAGTVPWLEGGNQLHAVLHEKGVDFEFLEILSHNFFVERN